MLSSPRRTTAVRGTSSSRSPDAPRPRAPVILASISATRSTRTRSARLAACSTPPAGLDARGCSGTDVHPHLYAARPAQCCAAEEGPFEGVLVVEHVLDVQLRPDHTAAKGERIPHTGVHDEVGVDLDRLVEVQQPCAVRRVGTVAIRQSASVDTGC